MTKPTSAEASIDVGVDPATAFRAFTEEMNEWWQRGPINFFDASRAYGMRCDSGVGGRIVEVYDPTTGDGLELARITVWEPGSRLYYRSSVDDTAVEVEFSPSPAGTRVSVRHYLVHGGEKTHGLFWVRTVASWFPAYCRRRVEGAQAADHHVAKLGLVLDYERPVTAARWLASAFGLDLPPGLPSEGEDAWVEFRIGTSQLFLFKGSRATDSNGHTVWVFVDNLEAHLDRSRSAGAKIISDIRQHGYRNYAAVDLEGHRWMFVQSLPSLPPR